MNTVLTIPSSPTCQEDHFFTAHLEDKHFLATCQGDHHIVRRVNHPGTPVFVNMLGDLCDLTISLWASQTCFA